MIDSPDISHTVPEASSAPASYSEASLLTAGQCGAEGVMPVTLLVARAIEVATAHANLLGIGYATLKELNLAWVLSRMSVEVLRYPAINETYTVETWIESFSRRFSERNFTVTDAQGRPVAYMRSVWAAVDVKNRSMGDLDLLGQKHIPMPATDCPIGKYRRTPHAGYEAPGVRNYRFQYCDIDFNRHVNSVKYLDIALNSWPVEVFDRLAIRRLDVAYMAECRFGEEAQIRIGGETSPDRISHVSIERDGRQCVSVRIEWEERTGG